MSSTLQVKPKTVTFQSFGDSLLLVRKEAVTQPLPNGEKMVTETPVQYGTAQARATTDHPLQSEAVGTVFTVEAGQDVLPTYYGPRHRGFRDTEEEQEDAVSWLRRHPLFGERFFEHESEAPSPEDVFLEIGKAQAAGNLDRLNELAEFEIANWNRERVMEALRDAYDAVTQESSPED